MDDLTQQRIGQSVLDRKALHPRFAEHIKTYPSFLALEQKAFQDGVPDRKTKEWMALSISIVTKCEPCMEWHVQQALLNSATDAEIHETIDMSIEMGGGPAATYSRFVFKAMDYHKSHHR